MLCKYNKNCNFLQNIKNYLYLCINSKNKHIMSYTLLFLISLFNGYLIGRLITLTKIVKLKDLDIINLQKQIKLLRNIKK